MYAEEAGKIRMKYPKLFTIEFLAGVKKTQDQEDKEEIDLIQNRFMPKILPSFLTNLNINLVDAPKIKISSSHIRELIKQKKDVKLLIDIESGLRLVSYRPGYIEFTPTDLAPANLAQRLSNRLKEWTGIRWAVSVVQDGEAQTIIEKKERNAKELETKAYSHPFVKEALVQFPAARIVNVISRKKLEEEAAIQALEEVDSEWDPFEED